MVRTCLSIFKNTLLFIHIRSDFSRRNIKQNRSWFYFKFSVESSSFILQSSLSFVWFYQSVFLSVKRIVAALMPSLIFRCFSLFLPHLRTLAQENRSQDCLRFGTGGLSPCLYLLLSLNIIFFPTLTMAARAKNKNSVEAICSRYQSAPSGF